MIPLLALVPLVIAGISALTSAAGTAASVVLSNKQADEQQRHNKAVEQIAQGGNIEDDIKNDNNLQIGLLANSPPSVNGKGINPLLVSSIIAIIPELIKAVPEAANQIKQLINGEGIKIDEPKFVSDDKLIDQYTKFLRGKKYDISM